MRIRHLGGYLTIAVSSSCGAASPDARSMPSPSGPSGPASDVAQAARPSPTAPAESAGSDLTDQARVAFRADFSNPELGYPWNIFGARSANRVVKGGLDGLWIKIADAERAWDAVGARTAAVKVDGDYDLRGRFRDFSASGNGSAKLIVVDATQPRGEAVYVERIRIDGKNLFKFGGEVEGTLENWGFVATDATGADLRLVRLGRALRALTRPDERSPWNEFAHVQEVPKSMPRVVKFGMKLSAEAHRSAQVRWVELTLNGQVLRAE